MIDDNLGMLVIRISVIAFFVNKIVKVKKNTFKKKKIKTSFVGFFQLVFLFKLFNNCVIYLNLFDFSTKQFALDLLKIFILSDIWNQHSTVTSTQQSGRP